MGERRRAPPTAHVTPALTIKAQRERNKPGSPARAARESASDTEKSFTELGSGEMRLGNTILKVWFLVKRQ